MMNAELAPFASWLTAAMQTHDLSQAALARTLGVADTQVSRWRRGQVVPSVRYLQDLADTFGVDRLLLDQLVGYPTASASGPTTRLDGDAGMETELHAYQAQYRRLLEDTVPRALWPAYMEACAAVAAALSQSFHDAVRAAAAEVPGDHASDATPRNGQRLLGFRSHTTTDAERE